MYIHNVRYGFATNSSSTHSIVLIGKNQSVSDDTDGQSFGWNFFTAKSEEAKRQYMGQQVKYAFENVHHLGSEEAAIIASNWAGTYIDPEGYVDHQSSIAMPCKKYYGYTKLRRDFFDDLLKFVLSSDVAILGGNDNDESQHPLLECGVAESISKRYWRDRDTKNSGLNFFLDNRSSDIRARYDETGKFWSLFDTRDGAKIRCAFVPDANSEKSEAPELVDIKITDFCDEGCRYCYQGSTPKGTHADKDVIRNITYALEKLEVFEVAIGGGEPTAHPNFISILDDFKNHGIKPSFSTRREDWVVDNWDKIKESVGAIGLSVDDNYILVNKLSKLQALNGLKVTVQVPVGSCSEESLKDIMKTCEVFNVTVLLLGWKNTHRGSKGPNYEVNLEKVLDSFKLPKQKYPNGEEYTTWDGPSVAFDTVLVQQMQGWLKENADSWRFTIREGAHSMYIDAVEKKMAKSSYEKDAFMPLDMSRSEKPLSDRIKEYFSTL